MMKTFFPIPRVIGRPRQVKLSAGEVWALRRAWLGEMAVRPKGALRRAWVRCGHRPGAGGYVPAAGRAVVADFQFQISKGAKSA